MKKPSDMPSASVPDWSREECGLFEWSPSKQLLASVRKYQSSRGREGLWGEVGRLTAVLQHRFWSIVTGADIPLDSKLGGGLLLPHPNGVVIYPDAEIGPNCLMFQQVTIGTRGKASGAPKLGGHVDLGAGAKILGDVTIGDNAVIGANAVVISDIPPGATAVGIPARVLEGRDESDPSK